jgi:hypothetical protein
MSVRQRPLSLWGWVLPSLLLLVLLGGRGLDADGLWFDELWSVYNAGGADGPLSPGGILIRLATEDPDQGVIHPLLLAAWGAVAGWSEFSTRLLSLLAGCLAVAWAYRLGRATWSPAAGVAAAALLASSAFFIHYTHELRVMTLLVLFAALALWYYRRVLVAPRPRLLDLIGLTFSGAALLYAHYFGGLLLIAIGLYHLLLVPKTRRWWWPVGLLLLSGGLFLPWLPVFLSGAQRAATRVDVHQNALSPLPLLEALFGYYGNGLALPALLLCLGGAAWAIWRSYGDGDGYSPGAAAGERRRAALIAFITLLLLPALLLTQALLQLVEPARVRYLLILWLPLTLCAGYGLAALWQAGASRGYGYRPGRAVALVIALLWGLNALRAAADPAFSLPFGDAPVPRWQAMIRLMQREGQPQDIFTFDAGERHYEVKRSFDAAVAGLPFPAWITRALVEAEQRPLLEDHLRQAWRVWYGVDTSQPVLPAQQAMQQLLAADFVLCDVPVASDRLRFSLYARSAVFCPGGPPRMQFGDGVTLAAAGSFSTPVGQTLRLPLRWLMGPAVPPDTYSLAVHVLADADRIVAQWDGGLRPLMQPEIDLSALPAGTYQLALIVYDWRTLARLPGVDLASGAAGERLPLLTFEHVPAPGG